MALSFRRQGVAVKIESTPGDPETLSSADANFVVRDIQFAPQIETVDREIFRDSLGTLPAIQGVRRGEVSFTTELAGSGDHTTTAPPFDAVLRACGYGVTTGVWELVTDSNGIGGGPFVHGETVTGGTSLETGTVCISAPTSSAVSSIFIYGRSGAFTATEEITGGTSGATADLAASGHETEVGRMYKPVSNSFEFVTTGVYLGDADTSGSLFVPISGCLGNVTLSGEAGQLVELQCQMTGALEDPSDETFVSGNDAGSTVPPRFIDAQVRLHDGFTGDIQQVSLSTGNTIDIRRSANEVSGVKQAVISSRAGTGSINPEGTLVADHDFFGKWFASSTGAITFRVGDTAGQRFFVQAPRSQYNSIAPGDRSGITEFSIDLALHETAGNDELIILAV